MFNLNFVKMAKIKWGMIVTDGRGKLGGQVFSKNRSGAYIRTKVTPSNPRTADQMAGRSILGSLSASWSGLTDEQRRLWNNAVEEWQKTDIFGDSRKPTGKNLFTGLNKEIEQSGGTRILVPPVKVVMPELPEIEPVVEISAQEVTLGITSVPAGFMLQVSATASLSQGTNFVKDKLRVIGYQASGTVDSTKVYSQYVAKFGAPTAGANIHFAVKLVAETGQAGVRVTAKADVQA